MFYTEQEMLAQIKGWEYIIAVFFLSLFLVFWMLLSRERRRRRSALRRNTVSALRQVRHQEPPVGITCPVCQPSAKLSRKTWQTIAKSKEDCSSYSRNALPCWIVRGLVQDDMEVPCASCEAYVRGMEQLTKAAVARAKGDSISQAPAA